MNATSHHCTKARDPISMSEPVRILDWYRVDSSRRTVRVLVTGSAMLLLGGLIVAVSFLARQPERVRECAVATGLLIVAGSVGFTSITMHRLVRNDVSLAIRTDGLCLNTQGTETVVSWSELVRARWETAPRALVIERAGAEPVLVAWVPAGISGPDLAARVEREKQRAAMGLLR